MRNTYIYKFSIDYFPVFFNNLEKKVSIVFDHYEKLTVSFFKINKIAQNILTKIVETST